MLSYYINFVKQRLLSVGGVTTILIAAIFVWQITTAGSGSGFLEADFYDVGQGDAIFIEGPRGEQILIDGGPDSKILEKLGKELDYFDRYIDVVIATHPEKDHIGGLIDVLKYYDIGEVWVSGVRKNTPFYTEFADVIKNKNIPVRVVSRGDYFKLGDFNIAVLNPIAGQSENKIIQESKYNINDTSIVIKVIYGDISLFLTGDIASKIENDLLAMESDANIFHQCVEHGRCLGKDGILDSDILKIAHHGSKTSSADDFLKRVSPEIAIIQVGKDNPYHHPHPSIMERLRSLGIPVLRNDFAGDIEIISDGEKYTATISRF